MNNLRGKTSLCLSGNTAWSWPCLAPLSSSQPGIWLLLNQSLYAPPLLLPGATYGLPCFLFSYPVTIHKVISKTISRSSQ